jgi:DNA-binding NarL/FixJ family response regulator
LDFIKELKLQQPGMLTMVVSVCDEMVYAERALQAGACGYVMKNCSAEEILGAIRMVLAGDFYVSRKIGMLALREMAGKGPRLKSRGLGKLTDRELQVFGLLGAGMTTQKIAARLCLSPKTIQTHRENIKHKLGLSHANELERHATLWVEGKDAASLGILGGAASP